MVVGGTFSVHLSVRPLESYILDWTTSNVASSKSAHVEVSRMSGRRFGRRLSRLSIRRRHRRAEACPPKVYRQTIGRTNGKM